MGMTTVTTGIMGTTVPTVIATPTITIPIPIIHLATTTIPMVASGTGDMGDGKEGAGGSEAAEVSAAAAVGMAAAVSAAGAVGMAAAVGAEDIADLALASNGRRQHLIHPGSSGR